jgi:hypothetical protein
MSEREQTNPDLQEPPFAPAHSEQIQINTNIEPRRAHSGLLSGLSFEN